MVRTDAAHSGRRHDGLVSESALPTDAILWSTPERDRADRPLIVLLHGYGSHEGDLFSLAPALPLDATIASLRAPTPIGPGFGWWDFDPDSPREPGLVDAAARLVLGWLDTIDSGPVSLLGFSQGGAVALELLRLAPDRFASAVCLAGFIVSDQHAGDAALARVRPPVFWGRGTDDTVIPDEDVVRTQAWLPKHADATVRIYEGLGHSVSTPELTDLVRFLRQHAA
jgi:phospholipase/carboxylesterase